MTPLFALFRLVLARFTSFFPSKLPTGRQEFDKFATSILLTYGFPDELSYRNAIASMIQLVPNNKSHMPKRYFAIRMRKAQANEVAFYVMKEIKDELIKKKTEAEGLTAPLPQTKVEQEVVGNKSQIKPVSSNVTVFP